MKKRKLDPRVERQRKADWEKMIAKYPSKNVTPKALPPMPVFRRETPAVKSLITSGKVVCSKPVKHQYTGNKILGIGTMHKSNAVPIFNESEAQDIARMRR